MARRHETSTLDMVFELTPTCVGPILAAAIFLLFRYGVPLLTPAPKNGMDPGAVTREFMPLLAWLFGGCILSGDGGVDIGALVRSSGGVRRIPAAVEQDLSDATSDRASFSPV